MVVALKVFRDSRFCDAGGLKVVDFQHGHTHLFAQHLQLVAGGRALRVGGNQERAAALGFVERSQFAGGGGFACALQADHEPDVAAFAQGGLGVGAAQHFNQFVVDDLDYLLAGGQGIQHVCADGFFLDFLNEVLGDVEVDIGLK